MCSQPPDNRWPWALIRDGKVVEQGREISELAMQLRASVALKAAEREAVQS